MSVHVYPTRTRSTRSGSEFSTVVSVGTATYPLRISASEQIASPRNLGDVWVPIALMAAMKTGTPLHLDEPISPLLRSSLSTIQSIFTTWYRDYSVVEVVAPVGRKPRGARGSAAYQFFTGGVDSFFTALSNQNRISALVYTYGFDVSLDDLEHRGRVSHLLRSASKGLGTRVIELESNMRTLLDDFGDWGFHTHGAALASITALLSRNASCMLLPASHTYNELVPWASHPLLDPLWSSDAIRLIHHGADSGRYEKIERITSSALALAHLRVCWQTSTELNCSQCEKCLRTMTSLDILGRLGDAHTFTGPLVTDRLGEMHIRNESDLSFTTENIRAARARGRVDIADALQTAVARYLR